MIDITKISKALDNDSNVSPKEMNFVISQCINGDLLAVGDCSNVNNIRPTLDEFEFTIYFLLRGFIHFTIGAIDADFLVTAELLMAKGCTTTVKVTTNDKVGSVCYKISRTIFADSQILARAKNDSRGLTGREFKVVKCNLAKISNILAARRFKLASK